MKIKTHEPLLHEQIAITNTIASFWDQISEGWQTIWGPHIHHGFYDNNEPLTPLAAQEKLIDKLADLISISPQDRILDAGSGMGGSSLYLAKKYQADVCGITLSSKQTIIASQQAHLENIKNVIFVVEDALWLNSFADHSFDVVWSLESCEQFYDKKLFIQNAYRVLKPGGKLMLATWCASHDEYEGTLAKKYKKLCLAFDLPYTPTMEYYSSLLKLNGFSINSIFDWSTYVDKSWHIGISLVSAYSILKLLKMSGWRGLRFASQIKLMRDAFREKRIRYGVFCASKPL